jgi:hypothetical protein
MATLEELDARLKANEAKVADHDAKLGGVMQSINAQAKANETIDGRFSEVAKKAADVDAEIGTARFRGDDNATRITALEGVAAPVTAIEGWYGHFNAAVVSPVFSFVKAMAKPAMYAVFGGALLFGALKAGCVPAPVPVVPPVVPVTPVTPVNPADPFATALQNAYAADGKPAAAVAQLAAIYANSAAVVNNTQNTTAKQVQDVLHAAAVSTAAIGANGLPNVRKAISTELSNQLGTQDHPLAAADRAAMATQFGRVATLLEALK